MHANDLFNIQLSQVLQSIIDLNQYEISRFSLPIDDNPDGITSLRRLRQTCHEIHGNVIPFPLMNTQRLHQT